MSESKAMQGAQAVFRAIAILEAFSAERPARTLADVAEDLQLSPPTVHRLLRALQAHDLVVYDEVSRRYSLGPGVIRLANTVLNRADLLMIAQPRLDDLRSLTGETVGLHWRVATHRVCLIELVSVQPVRMASGLGEPYPLVAGAAGKAILAHLGEADFDAIVRTEREAGRRISERRLRVELDEVRDRGFAMSCGETVPEASAIAAPILDPSGRALAAVNITGPQTRLTQRRMTAAVGKLLAVAGELTEQLGSKGDELPLATS
jgi:DNA-binding IclR family transcriptional regulator